MTYDYINNTGAVLPDTSTILTDVQGEYLTVFTQALSLDPSTPQGGLISADTLVRTALTNNNAAIANQINPNFAGGVFLDALMGLTGQQRTGASQTIVSTVTLAGIAGTLIPAGSQAQTAAGDLFQTTASVTIAGTGTVTATFISVQYGAIPCGAGALNQVVSAILGWETVTNPNAGVIGAVVMSDQVARALRKNTLAFQGVALPQAILSALYNVPGVTSVFFQENYTNATQTINGISMVPNSIYACVNGGDNTKIGKALLENKSAGSNWNGSTTVNLTEPASGQVYPVKFDIATPIGILVRVTTRNGDPTIIANAIIDYAAGNIAGFPALGCGTAVSPFEIAGAIITENPGFTITKVEVTLTTAPTSWQTTTISLAVNQIASIPFSNISVIVTG